MATPVINTTHAFNLPSPYQAEMAKIADQRRMAEMLQAQSQAPTERFSYKGIEARTPVTAGLAKALQGFAGAYFQKQAREEEKALGERYRAEQMGDMSELIRGLNAPAVAGSAAIPEQLAGRPFISADEEGNQMPDVSAAPAIPAVVARAAGQIDPSMMGRMKTQEGANQVLALVMAQRQAQIDAERRANEPFNLRADEIRFQTPVGGGAPVAVAKGTPKPLPPPFAQINLEKFTPESLAAAINPDGTVDRTKLVAISAPRTGQLGVYDEYAKQMRAAGKVPKTIEQFETDQKIAGRTPAVQRERFVYDADRGGVVNLDTGVFTQATQDGKPISARVEKLRPIPATVNAAIIGNEKANNQLDRAIALLSGKNLPGMTGDDSATGLKGYLPIQILNRLDPQGVAARAEIADIGSLILHDRSGAVITASESPRLMPFIPTTKDDNASVLKKLTRLKLELSNETAAMRDIYSTAQGYIENPILNKPSVSKEKITTKKEIEDVAAKTGKTVEQVTIDAINKGYKVNP